MDLAAYLDAHSPGAAVRLARAIGVTPVLISQWRTRKRQVPTTRCPAIERATAGAVTCEEMRQDVDWAYLRGSRKRRGRAA